MVKSKKKKNQQKKGYWRDYRWGPGGNMPPWMGGPCPDDSWGPEGDMPPWMGGPSPDDMWQPRNKKHRKNTQPNMRGPCPNMGDAKETMSSGPNAPDQRQCRTFGGPGKSSSGNKQLLDRCGTNSQENGPSLPGNCSSDQPASGNAAESAADTQRHYTEEGAARILSNFGLSTKDLEEFGHYSDDQLKPENMAMILRDIVERKKARQLPASSQGKEEETAGGHGGSDSPMKRPVVPSAAQPTTTPVASFIPQSSVSPSPSMMNDYHAVSPTVLPHMCSLCKIECANMTDWNLHVGTVAHTEKCDQLRQQHPDWNPEDCSLLQRHEGDKKEKHIPLPCSTSSNPNASQHSIPGHASSQTRSRSRSPRCRSRSSERPSSPSSSSQSSSSQKRELGRSTRSPVLSAEAGSSRQPPAKSDVAEQPPNKSEHPMQTNPGHQELPKKDAAAQEQGDQQPPAKSDVAEQPPNKSENPLQSNLGHQELPKKEAATQEQGDRQCEDLRLALMPLAEQSVMQALSLLQSGGAVGAGLAQGTSLPPFPLGQIDPALSLVFMMQLVATQVVQAALASKEASSVQGSPGAAGPSPQSSIPAGSEEKKQESSQEVVLGVTPSCSGLATVRIWIVGHSIVHWASLRAAESGLGLCLGLPNHVSVSWISKCEMRWDEFLPMVQAKVSCEGPPAAIVVQLGENDLVSVQCLSLRSRIQEDLEKLASAHPGLKIFWSQLLQRRVWLGSHRPIATERSRRRIESAIAKAVIALGGAVIRHAGITFKDDALYRADGVNLSNAGNDVWLSEVSLGLMGWLQV